jgi:putative copper resistance protein D
MTTTLLILARAIHIGACLLLFGIFAFDRLVAVSIQQQAKSEIAEFWRARIRVFSLVLLPAVLLSGMCWFALVAMTMSGQSLQVQTLKIVWAQTQFGAVWKLRLYLWLATCIAAAFCRSPVVPSKMVIWIQMVLSGGLLGSLAWAGHGRETSVWHLFADLLHLLVAGLWPSGLLPFALLLKKLRRSSDPTQAHLTAILVRRFPALSLGSVSLLTLTGFVNSWYLVGSFSNLFQQPYGRWLLAKIILFGIIIAIGAVNLLRLKPRISDEALHPQAAKTAAGWLQFNVQSEWFLSIIVVIIIAVLGIMPPAIH